MGGRVADRQGWVFDERSRLNQDLADAVGRLEEALQPYSCAVRDQAGPSGLPKAVDFRLGIEGTGLWWERDTDAGRRWGAVVGDPSAGDSYLGRVVPEAQEDLGAQACH